MVLPLVMLAVALASKKLQDDEQKKAYEHQLNKQLAETTANIQARRAARAGDSGYMQAAAGATAGFPQMGPSQAGGMLSQVGSALMSQKTPPAAVAAPQIRATPDAYKPVEAYQPITRPLVNDVPDYKPIDEEESLYA